MGPVEVLAGIGLLAAVGGGLAALGLALDLSRSERRFERVGAWLGEAARLREAERVLAVQKVTEAAIEGGTRTAQILHHGIASIPFTILEAIPVTRQPARIVRETHHFIADGVYDAILAANRGLGRLLRGTRHNPD